MKRVQQPGNESRNARVQRRPPRKAAERSGSPSRTVTQETQGNPPGDQSEEEPGRAPSAPSDLNNQLDGLLRAVGAGNHNDVRADLDVLLWHLRRTAPSGLKRAALMVRALEQVTDNGDCKSAQLLPELWAELRRIASEYSQSR